jgi:hypothetical protein
MSYAQLIFLRYHYPRIGRLQLGQEHDGVIWAAIVRDVRYMMPLGEGR